MKLQSSLVAKRFFVDFNFGLNASSATWTVDATIPAVPLDRALVHRVGGYWGHSDGSVVWHVDAGGVYFTSPTNLRLTYSGGYDTSNYPLSGQIFRAEVIVLSAKPRSLQNLAGNGAAGQTIASVNTDRALILDGIFRMRNVFRTLRPTFDSPTQVTWSDVLTANDRYQVVEL